LAMVADVLDHAFVIAADGIPAAAGHGGPFARAKTAIRGAHVRGHQQDPVGIAMGQARQRRIFFLLERVFQLVGGLQLARGSHRLQADRVVRIFDVDEREVVRWDGELEMRLQGTDGFELFRGERQKIAKLTHRADGILRLPPPIVPVLGRNAAPERMAPRLTGGFLFLDAVDCHRPRLVMLVEPGTLIRLVHRLQKPPTRLGYPVPLATSILRGAAAEELHHSTHTTFMYPNYKADHKQNRKFFLKTLSMRRRAKPAARVSPVFFLAK